MVSDEPGLQTGCEAGEAPWRWAGMLPAHTSPDVRNITSCSPASASASGVGAGSCRVRRLNRANKSLAWPEMDDCCGDLFFSSVRLDLMLTPLARKKTVTLSLTDKDFGQLVAGKANAQKLFMTGKLKIKGDVMKATKIEPVFKKVQTKAKL